MVDKLDRDIIIQLGENARLSNVAMAKMLYTSERTIRNRINRLLEKEIISITAIPNLEALGFGFISVMVFQVNLADLRRIADELSEYPDVCYLANVTGRYDLIAVIVAKSQKEFYEFVTKNISAIPGIIRTETFVCIDICKGSKAGFDMTQIIRSIS
jgi:Lrp/AsnC family transcriptional regulator for asnA, asnC and gidA